MAATNENIHVLVPTEYHEGALTLTARGLPKSIADFVRASKMFFPPASINVRDVIEERAGLSDVLTPRQFECFQLAVKHGFYNEPKEITLQGLSQVMNICNPLNKPFFGGSGSSQTDATLVQTFDEERGIATP
jgi:hypothetical protein